MTKLVDKDATHIVEEDNVTPPPMYEEGRPQIVTADTARNGPRGTPVLWVLIAACVLAAAGILAAWIYVGASTGH
jgi:hypothetical protein